MSISMQYDSSEVRLAVPATLYSLSYHGVVWARASLNVDASVVTLASQTLSDVRRFAPVVRVQLETVRPLGCSVHPAAVRSWPTSLHQVLERPLRGAEQLLALVNARGEPWAEVEIGDQVHLFDPSGRERVRIIRGWDPNGSRLAVRCWDEWGHEIAANEYVSP